MGNTVMVRADLDKAMDFLEKFRPGGPWVLVAIVPDGPLTAATLSSPDELREWLDLHAHIQNIYFQVNSLMRSARRKSKKEDIASMDWLWVDLDPRPGETDLEKERERAIGLLRDFDPLPTCIISSGTGIQGFWKLIGDQQLVINGDLKKAAGLEAYNIELEQQLGADQCHNCDRIMRLPGTLNFQNKTKARKYGPRGPVRAELLEFHGDRVYPLNSFIPAGSHQDPAAASMNVSVDIAGKIDSVDLESLTQVSDFTKKVIVHGKDQDHPDRWPSRSEALFYVVCELVRKGISDNDTYAIITRPELGISAHIRDHADPHAAAIRNIQQAKAAVAAEIVLDPGEPLRSASLFVKRNYTQEGMPTLLYTNSEWVRYEGSHYEAVEDTAIRAELYGFLDSAWSMRDGKRVPFAPTRRKVEDVLDALKAAAHVPREQLQRPAWLRGDGPDPGNIVSCRNGLLVLDSAQLLPHTPRFFTRSALPFEYSPAAAEPVRWLQFLRELWPDDADSIDTLAEVFGYLVVLDTSLQKIFLVVGPRRSGKGTIARVLGELVGEGNIAGPTLHSLGTNFGLAALIGKQVAVIADARLGYKTDSAAVTERLLSISGEDALTVDRKHRDAWYGTLPTRFIILTNEMPRLTDVSGALAGRFVVLRLTESFYGREDLGLFAKLQAELPGILNWALEGLRRLRRRGHFAQPRSSDAFREQLEEMGSPVAAFARDRCVLDPDRSVPCAVLYRDWCEWCQQQGRRWTGDQASFGRDLAAAFPQIQRTYPRDKRGSGERVYHYQGIGLRDEDVPF